MKSVFILVAFIFSFGAVATEKPACLDEVTYGTRGFGTGPCYGTIPAVVAESRSFIEYEYERCSTEQVLMGCEQYSGCQYTSVEKREKRTERVRKCDCSNADSQFAEPCN